MADQHSTRAALYAAIEGSAKETTDAHRLLELAYAWRALVGGQQPGTGVVEK